MSLSRRRSLRLIGGSIIGITTAGCLSSIDRRSTERSIDGRLHNHTSSSQTIAITADNEDNETMIDDEWEVDPNETHTVSDFGKPGEEWRFSLGIDGDWRRTLVRFAPSADAEQGSDGDDWTNGYVDVTYIGGEPIAEFTTAEDPSVAGGLWRIDEPPYQIEDQECEGIEPGEEDEENMLWLCENIDTEPSLAFDLEEVSHNSNVFENEGLRIETRLTDSEYFSALVTTRDDLDRLDIDDTSPTNRFIKSTNFDNEVLLFVQSGWKAGNWTPHLTRIEDTDEGIHAYGCLRKPCHTQDGDTNALSTCIARFQPPERLEKGNFSLTVSPSRRVNFEVGEGIVSI